MGSRDVIGHVTIRLQWVDFLSVVHGDHASILHRYVDMAPQILDALTWTRKERRKKGRRKRKGKGKGKERGMEKVKGKGKKNEKGEGKGEGKVEGR